MTSVMMLEPSYQNGSLDFGDNIVPFHILEIDVRRVNEPGYVDNFNSNNPYIDIAIERES